MTKFFSFSLFLIASFISAAPVASDEKTEFIKVENKQGNITALKTSIVSYKRGDVTVDLVGALHFADKEYYKTLNQRFSTYDAVLYELVAEQNTKPPKDRVSFLGVIAKTLADLDSQLEKINYKKANFIHADLSFREMEEIMNKQGEDKLTLGLRVFADILQQQNKAKNSPLNVDTTLDLLNMDSPIAIKRVLAKQFNKVGSLVIPSLEEILVKVRNKAAVQVMEREIKNSKKRLAIFYGAAHMEDMEKRIKVLGFVKTRTEWLTAWDLEEE